MVKGKNTKLNISSETTKQTVICAVLLVVIVVAFAMMFISHMDRNQEAKYDTGDDQLWEEAYNEGQETRIGITFNPINTNEEEYQIMRNACNKFIDSELKDAKAISSNNDSIDPEIKQVDVNVQVNENTYIDKNKEPLMIDTSADEEETEATVSGIDEYSSNDYQSNGLVETGPIYFNNLLMIRYINSSGNFKVISSHLVNNDEGNELLQQSEMTYSNLGFEKMEMPDLAEKVKNDSLTEAEYIKVVSDCFKIMTTDEQLEISDDAINKAMSLFTIDGKNSVNKSVEALGITEGSKLELIFSLAGKSDLNKDYKDRVYLRYAIYNERSDVTYANIILKLNKYTRIFDIDIV